MADHLIQILLPTYDNDGQPFPAQDHAGVRTELTDRFGGLTAFTRAPAEGVWKDQDDRPTGDDVVIFEVMATGPLDEDWWGAYRSRLEIDFRQERIIVRAHAIRLL
jgi:hypothetical protein